MSSEATHDIYSWHNKKAFESGHAPGSPNWCRDLSYYIEAGIDDDSVEEYAEDKHRGHLGASEIGDPCARRQWYGFRWTRKAQFDGRMYRLFQRGHAEEAKFVHRLYRIGIIASDVDPATGKQYRITSEFNRHFGGSLDSVCRVLWLPPDLADMLGEFKTHNKASFDKLKKDGVMKAKPRHFAQMSTYGRRKGFKLGLYCAVCKDTDRFWIEVVRLDDKLGAMLEEKADHIISSQVPPRKLSETPTHFECKNCNFAGVCHYRQQVDRNCRSCHYAYAHASGVWCCAQYNITLADDLIVTGCATYYPIV